MDQIRMQYLRIYTRYMENEETPCPYCSGGVNGELHDDNCYMLDIVAYIEENVPLPPRKQAPDASSGAAVDVKPSYAYADLLEFYEIMVSIDAQNDAIAMLREDEEDLSVWADLVNVCERLRDARKAAQQAAGE